MGLTFSWQDRKSTRVKRVIQFLYSYRILDLHNQKHGTTSVTITQWKLFVLLINVLQYYLELTEPTMLFRLMHLVENIRHKLRSQIFSNFESYKIDEIP